MMKSYSKIVLILSLFSWLQAHLLKWQYELLDIKLNSLNPEYAQGHLEVARIKRGKFGVNGWCDLKIALLDDCMVNIQTFRSPTGTAEYSRMPFEYKDQTCVNAMNTLYRETIMHDIQKCSNLPLLDRDWKGPIEPKMYIVNKCFFTTENLPSYVRDGYYKIIVHFTGKVEVIIQVLIKVEQTVM